MTLDKQTIRKGLNECIKIGSTEALAGWAQLHGFDLLAEVERLEALARRLYTTTAALRAHVKGLRSIPTLKEGESPPRHLIDKAKELNLEVDNALAAYEASQKEKP